LKVTTPAFASQGLRKIPGDRRFFAKYQHICRLLYFASHISNTRLFLFCKALFVELTGLVYSFKCNLYHGIIRYFRSSLDISLSIHPIASLIFMLFNTVSTCSSNQS
jgi:hypothetical protein